MRWIAGCLVVVFAFARLSAAQAETVVCAPGAMSDAMTALSALAAHQGLPFKTIIGHSPAQARQIVEGAPCDVFISADPQWMDFLATQDLLAKPPVILASTHLVLFTHEGDGLVFTGRPGESLALALHMDKGDGRLAMADPDMVPAGRMAVAALVAQGSWPGLAGRLALTQNVRAVAALVQRGEVPAGIGFASDLTGAQGLRILYDFSDGGIPPVRFPMAVIKGRDGGVILAFLRRPESRAILRANGFQ